MEEMRELVNRLNSMGLTCDNKTQEEWAQYDADSFNASEGNLHERDGYQCKVCHNKGYLMKAVQTLSGYWVTAAYDCKCAPIRRTILRMRKSGLKDIIKDYTFDKFYADEPWQKTIKEAAQEYAKNPEGWYFIGGQSGCGKTHVCTAICRELLLEGKAVVYMLWRDDISKIKAVANEPERDELINKFKKAEVLYIDDLFKTGKATDGAKQRPTPADINAAFEIINHRYNEKLPTIISSECTIDDLLDIDEATGGRIFERARAFSMKQDRSRNYRLRGVTEI